MTKPTPTNNTVSAGVIVAPVPTGTYSQNNADNCVYFLSKTLGVNLPKGLDTIQDKENIINVSGAPQPGDVAIITTNGTFAPEGHMALVQNVTNGSITIIESHWKGNSVDTRTSTSYSLEGAAHQLNIVGYYRPPQATD